MKLNIEIDADMVDEVTFKNLSNNLDTLTEVLSNVRASKKGSGTFSWNYEDDVEGLEDIISNLEGAKEWFQPYD